MNRLFLVLGLLLMAVAHAWDGSQVVVVYNNDSALSRNYAWMYCRLRGVPENQSIGLSGLGRGDITRQEYDEKVFFPLVYAAQERGFRWPAGKGLGRKRILAMVLMPDLPLRVKQDGATPKGTNPGMSKNSASLDSELMMLGARYATQGSLKNPYYCRDVVKLDRVMPEVMPVCRIDAPDEESIRRMIQDPVEVEKHGLWGWVVVDQGGPYAQGDKMLKGVAELAQAGVQPLFHETSRKTLAPSFPLMERTAVYFGWYTERPDGPFKAGVPGGFRFAPGAIACHLHSFSATSIKDPKRWVGAMLMRGAAVTAGNVAEPYLAGCLDYKVFYEHLLRGETVAEAALAATPLLSWQSVVLGDPLYRPFATVNRATDTRDPFVRWRFLCRQSAGNAETFVSGIRRELDGGDGGLFAEMYAWLCAYSQRMELASTYFGEAAARYVNQRDRLRAQMLQAVAEKGQGHQERAEHLILQCASQGMDSPYMPAIRAVLDTIKPPPSPSPASPEKKGGS